MFDGRMSWEEAWSLTNMLTSDPSSRVGAAVQGWSYPLSREAMALADLYDVTLMSNVDKRKRGRVKPYPRPWETNTDTHRSSKPTVGQETIRAALAARGH